MQRKKFRTYTRLSSGLRINKASDDAAGLSISENLKTDTRIQNQGIRNLNDGASVLAIADSALNELSNITTRLAELAEQSANGTFGTKQRTALNQEAQALAKEYNRIARTTEFNGRKIFNSDYGNLSLAAGGSTNTLITGNIVNGGNDGTFSLGISNFHDVGASIDFVAIEDFNNDGYLDYAATDYYLSVLWRSYGNADGTFTSPVSIAGPWQGYDISAVDLDKDGVFDLVGAANGSTHLAVFKGNSDGSFKSMASYATAGPNQFVESGDFNGDGIIDLVSTNQTTNSISVILGNGDGTFKSSTSFRAPEAADIKVSDLNGDSILDFVVSTVSTSEILVFTGNGNGSFKSATTNAAYYSRVIELYDLNNDGNLDIVGGGNVGHVLYGNGDGTFNRFISYEIGGISSGFAIGDTNNDGNIDLVFSMAYSPSINVLLGNSNFSFKSPQQMIGVANRSISFADFNKDGALDLFGASATGIQIHLGNVGNGVSNLENFSISSQAESKQALTYFKDKITILTRQRGHVGAFQSRIEAATNNLHQSTRAYSEAYSRITDADIAEESSKLLAAQIIQQAATSILAQANQQPQISLRLLSGIR